MNQPAFKPRHYFVKHPKQLWISRRYIHRQVIAATVIIVVGLGLGIPAIGFGADKPFSLAEKSACIQDGDDAGKLAADAVNLLPEPSELSVGEWRVIAEVCPRDKFFPTSVLATPGATYEFSATGRWKDSWIRSGPEGWWFPPFQPFNRIPWTRMFVLSGTLGETLKNSFVIGSGTTWTGPIHLPPGKDRELKLFANDWDSQYENNRALLPAQGGPMRVTIRRLT